MSYIRYQGSSLATVNFLARLTFKQYKSCSPENVKLFPFLKNIDEFKSFDNFRFVEKRTVKQLFTFEVFCLKTYLLKGVQ